MHPSDDKQFLDLLEKWLRGDFTRADEQRLKVLAEADDFRREAMEGFMSLPEHNHAAQLDSLRSRLSGRAGGARTVSLGMRLLAAAAVLAVLITAFVFYPVWDLSKGDSMARQTTPAQEAPLATEQAPAPPETATDGYAANDDGHRAGDRLQKSPATRPLPSGEAEMKQDKMAVKDQEFVRAEQDVAQPGGAPASSVAAPAPQRTSPLRDTTYSAEHREAEDAKEEMAKKAPSVAQNKPVERKPDNTRSKAKSSRLKSEPNESGPQGGWEAFRTYLYSTARLTPEARNNNVSGQVRLQLSLGPNGEVGEVKILKGLGYGCDEAAIRLARAWKWERGAQPFVTFDVPFVR